MAAGRAGADEISAGRILPCTVQAARLIEQVRPALEEHGDLDRAVGFLRRLAERGCGAQRQRASWRDMAPTLPQSTACRRARQPSA
ncbi:hypothetical protein [Streptomyces sp. C10]|uniref:hypothetical protein n=1 Tax=Streptomyces sp. C10 TaxID=531941 RepID=UPI00397F0D7A